MNKLVIIPIIIGIIAAISASAILMGDFKSEPESIPIYESGFTYYDIELVQTALAEHDIIVSSPTAITDDTIDQYCLYFDSGLPRSVSYCTTAVHDSSGNSLGNINMGGKTDSPILAIANLETDSVDSNQEDVILIIETMIETLVCDCWEGRKGNNTFDSISKWVKAAHLFYYDSNERSTKSRISELGPSEIILEITPKENSILQTLIILK